jgi:hypothetical protein
MTADIPEKVMAKLTGQIPVGRAGRPEEVARGSLPCRRRIVVHHRAGVERQWWNGRVKAVDTNAGELLASIRMRRKSSRPDTASLPRWNELFRA